MYKYFLQWNNWLAVYCVFIADFYCSQIVILDLQKFSFVYLQFIYMLLYVDPGVGSFLIQAIIAGVVGFFYAIKLYGSKIKSFLSRKKEK